MSEAVLREQLAAALVQIEQLQAVVSKSETAGKCLQESSLERSASSGYTLQIDSWLELGAMVLFLLWICWRIFHWFVAAQAHLAILNQGNSLTARQGQLTFWQYFMYRVDCWFAQDPQFKAKLLLFMTIVLTAVGSVFYFFVAVPESYGEAVWAAWTFVADPGTHAEEKDWGTRLVAFVVSLGGMLVFALMIGLVTDTISMYVDSLKKGRSRVLEANHTLILGWSCKIVPLISELAEANASEGGSVIVICADKDAEQMDDLLQEMQMVDLQGSTVMCRQVALHSEADLRTVSVTAAKAIIILADSEVASDASDAQVLRTMLTVMAFEKNLTGHIVVELCDIDNKTHVHLIGGEHVEVVCSHDILGRMMVLSSINKGLSAVYEQLLGFQGCEFYEEQWPALQGKTFGEAVFWFETAIVCGIIAENGRTFINPSDKTILKRGDRVLVLAEDDSMYTIASQSCFPLAEIAACPVAVHPKARPENYLFCGWRRDIGDMMLLLDEFVPEGSTLTILCETPCAERDEAFKWQGRDMSKLENLIIKHVVGNPTIRHHLEKLNLSRFASILILAEEDELSARDSDAHTIATMLLIRDIQTEQQFGSFSEPGGPSPTHSQKTMTKQSQQWFYRAKQIGSVAKIACEILESHTKRLRTLQSVSEYIMSHEMISKYMAMVAEDRRIHKVLEELFSSVGNEIYLREVGLYVHPGEVVSFWGLTVRARARDEILLGYRSMDNDDNEIVHTLNPDAETRRVERTWDAPKVLGFIVLAQDD